MQCNAKGRECDACDLCGGGVEYGDSDLLLAFINKQHTTWCVALVQVPCWVFFCTVKTHGHDPFHVSHFIRLD